MKTKVGIIGYGKQGQIRHNAINETGCAEVVAISEPSDVNIDLPNLSHDDIINSPDIDAIIICTPNFLNKPLTIKALNAGKHVFCEKPPCFTAQDMREIREAEAASGGKKLMYGFNHRHHDSIIRMKQIVENKEYGNILWMRGRYGKSVTPDYFSQWRAKKELAGGGILLDQGIHMLDLFLYLAGDFDSVKAEVSNLYWKMDVEDINREKSVLNEATLALTRLKAANDAVAAASDTLSGYSNDCENAKRESEKWQAVVAEKRVRKEDLSKAVERETDWSKLLQQAHKSLHKGDTCPVCGNEIKELQPPKGENELDVLREQLRQADKDLQETEARILAANKNIEQFTKRIASAKKELDDKTAARDKQWQLTSQRLESCGRKIDQMANNAVADLLIDELGEKANQLTKRQEQASDLQRQIKAAREQLDKFTRDHTKTQIDLNTIIDSINSQRKAITNSTGRMESLTVQLNGMFIMPDWQERMAQDSGFIAVLEQKAVEFKRREESAQQLKHAISVAQAVIPGMQANKQNVVGLTDNGYINDQVPANLDEQWRQFENKHIEWNNRLDNERQNIERATTALKTFLNANPSMTIERLTLLGQHQQSDIDTIKRAIETLKDAITHMEGEIAGLDKRHQEIVANKPAFDEENREKLDEIIQTSQDHYQQLTEQIAELKAQLKADEEKQKEVGEKKEAMELAKAEFERWDELSSDLGDDKGKTFLAIAQSYLLGEMLNNANGYLRQFNNRYELEAKPGTLTILARDQLQGDLTSVNTLSGGESFMVSLALALALASTSGRIFSVDTLFIDEGFGSLSGDYLEKVMETLNRLYEIGGRRVGIISHVEALKGSVTTHIQVEPDQGNTTASRVTVVCN